MALGVVRAEVVLLLPAVDGSTDAAVTGNVTAALLAGHPVSKMNGRTSRRTDDDTPRACLSTGAGTPAEAPQRVWSRMSRFYLR